MERKRGELVATAPDTHSPELWWHHRIYHCSYHRQPLPLTEPYTLVFVHCLTYWRFSNCKQDIVCQCWCAYKGECACWDAISTLIACVGVTVVILSVCVCVCVCVCVTLPAAYLVMQAVPFGFVCFCSNSVTDDLCLLLALDYLKTAMVCFKMCWSSDTYNHTFSMSPLITVEYSCCVLI